jgi:hypothetical protein
MSATGRGLARIPSDNYPTPEWATHRLIDRVLRKSIFPLASEALEPCAGDGSIIRAFKSHPGIVNWPIAWTASDIRPECASALAALAYKVRIGDFRAIGDWFGAVRPRLTITNPPFNIAEEIIRAALGFSEWVVMLLRINFLGSEERQPWLSQNAPDVYVLPNRPPFALNKHGKPATDATEYAWMVWGPHSRGATRGNYEILDVTPLDVRKRHTAMLKGAA